MLPVSVVSTDGTANTEASGRVNFFIIGAPKSGTTALAQYLSEHPQIHVCEPKEPQYFTFDFPGHRGVADWPEYLALFPVKQDVTGIPVTGDASVWYLYSRAAIPAIRATFPDARLIAILRRPDEMLPSLYAQQRRMGIETAKSFSEAWVLEPLRRAGKRIPMACRTPEFLYYRTVARYGEQLQRVYQQFPSEQVSVFLYEELRQNPRLVYTKTLSFLGLENDSRQDFPVVNAYADVHSATIQSLLSWLRQKARTTHRRLVNPSSTLRAPFGGVTAFIDRWNRREIKKPALINEMRQHIIDCYRDDISLLETLLKRDLVAWTKINQS